MSASYDIRDINFGALMQPVAVALLGEPNRALSSRAELRFGSRGSLAAVIAGRKAGCWANHETGTGGGVLDLIRLAANCDNPIDWLREHGFLDGGYQPVVRMQSSPVNANPRHDDMNSVRVARAIWHSSINASGTIAEIYLASRGLALPADAPIRFHPKCPRGSDRLLAMVSLMTDPITAEPCGIHRTYLRSDGSGKAEGSVKMMLGSAGVIRLVPDEGVTIGLGICEGIETGLAIMHRARWSPIWAACSAGGIAKFPVLAGIEAITIFADMDDKGAGLASAQECAARWKEAGREAIVSKPPTGTDWLDALSGGTV